MPSLLPGTTMISTCSTFQSCRLNITDNLQRQGKCSNSCTRLVNPYWYLQLLQMTNQDLLYLWLSQRNLTLPHKTSKYHLLCKKNVVNSSQSNYTTENYLHIASIKIILNNAWVSYSENMSCIVRQGNYGTVKMMG